MKFVKQIVYTGAHVSPKHISPGITDDVNRFFFQIDFLTLIFKKLGRDVSRGISHSFSIRVIHVFLY